MKITSVVAQAWDVPMRFPYRSAQRVTTTAHNVLVTVTLDDGSVGYGESAPATYVTGETQESVLACAHQLAADLHGRDVAGSVLFLAEQVKTLPGAGGAMEMALLDAWARAQGVPLFLPLSPDPSPPRWEGKGNGLSVCCNFRPDLWRRQRLFSFPLALPTGGRGVRGEGHLQTDLSLPILSPEDAHARAMQAARDGFRALKIKVGCGDLDEDARRVRAVADGAPRATLRLDGNQGFSGEEAVRFFDGLSDLHARIELLEQPTKAGDDAAMRFVAERVSCPVFADESVHGADDARRLLENGTCGGVVLKLAKMGITGALAVGKAARVAGGICLFGCMMETRVATTAALHTALALGADVVPLLDLDGHLLVRDDALVQGGLTQSGDILSIDPARSGLGLTARAHAGVL